MKTIALYLFLYLQLLQFDYLQIVMFYPMLEYCEREQLTRSPGPSSVNTMAH